MFTFRNVLSGVLIAVGSVLLIGLVWFAHSLPPAK
jgi:hypothetical protein